MNSGAQKSESRERATLGLESGPTNTTKKIFPHDEPAVNGATSLLAFAQWAGNLGFSVVPTVPGEKRPFGAWKVYQTRLPTHPEIERWFTTPDVQGIGVITGVVSENLEALDFDSHQAFNTFCELTSRVGLGELWERVLSGYLDKSPRGNHTLYRCPVISGNQKLASIYDRDDFGEIKRDFKGKSLTTTLIETRGEGGFLIVPPSFGSTHPTGLPYQQVRGGLSTVVTISPEEREWLLDLARSLSEVVKETKSDDDTHTTGPEAQGTRPGDLFNARATWGEVLLPHGWVTVFERNGVLYWRRPGKDIGVSATTNYAGSDLLYVFSTNSDFESERGYSKFSAYARLNHGGDFGKAAAALAQQRYVAPVMGVVSGEPPLPLVREVPPATPYPVDKLGALGLVVNQLHAAIKAPLALCGQSVLAATTLAVQGHANIVLDGRVYPLSGYFITVGESGERKSAVDKEVLRPHRDYEKRLAEQYSPSYQAYENDAAAYKKAREEALKKAKTRDEKRAALEALGAPPEAPLLPILTTEEPTYEGLIKLLLHGQPSMGLFADEAGRFLGGYGMSEEHALKTAAGLSELWDGRRISRVRGGDGAALLYGRRLALHLMAQPGVAQKVLSNQELIDQGLVSRCLVTWPESTAGTRQYSGINLTANQVLFDYGGRIAEILATPLPLAEGKRNELVPRSIGLTPEARELWIKFHDTVEKNLAAEQPFSTIKGFANKAPEHALRLAGILALYDDLNAKEISVTTLGAGIDLAQHYLDEALRLFHSGLIDVDLILAAKLLTWAQSRGRYVPLIDIYQRGPNGVRDAATAKKLVAILCEHGWFKEVRDGMVIDGKMRKEVWEVVK